MKNNRKFSIRWIIIFPASVTFVLLIFVTIVLSYLYYSTNALNMSNSTYESTSKQILLNYETYFNTLLSASDSVLNEYASYDVANIPAEAQSFFDNTIAIKSDILSISIYKASDGSFIAGNSGTDSSPASVDNPWYSKAINNPYINIFSRPVLTEGTSKYFTLSRFVPYDKNSSYEAILKINCNFSSLVQIVLPETLGTSGSYIIYDSSYDIIFNSDTNYQGTKIEKIKEFVFGSNNIEYGNSKFFSFAASISNTSWRVAFFINQDAVYQTINTFILVCSLTGITLSGIGILVLFLVGDKISKPMKNLQKKMASIDSLGYSSELIKPENLGNTIELEELSKSFESLMNRIKNLTNEVVEQKEEQRKSELKALQNQINPHFLYNTLDSILAMIDKNENEKAEDMIVALSRFFRISISKGKNVIPLKDELEQVRNYLLIQKIRYGDKFNFTIKFDSNLANFQIVKLVLQPIVENSIYHGLKNDENGNIDINCIINAGMVEISISDDGYGMSKEQIELIKTSLINDSVFQGVGIRNVYLRLKMYYGNSATIKIESKEDVGSTFTIIVPYTQEGKNNE